MRIKPLFELAELSTGQRIVIGHPPERHRVAIIIEIEDATLVVRLKATGEIKAISFLHVRAIL